MLPLNYSKPIISYLCQCFIAHEEVMWSSLYQPCHLLMTYFHQWTSGIYIRLSSNFAKTAGKWGAQSQLITSLPINSFHIFSLIYQ